MTPKRLAVLGLVLIFASNLPAQNDAQPDSLAGDFIFKLPAGWTRVDQGERTILLAPGSTLNSALTYIVIQGFDLGGDDLETAFRTGWQAVVQTNGLETTGEIVLKNSANGFDYLWAAGAVSAHGKLWVVSLIGAQYGQRFETLELWTSESQDPLATEGVDDLLDSVRFGPAFPGG
jgi:hypothetical protein